MRERAIALAGLMQAIKLVHQMANTGQAETRPGVVLGKLQGGPVAFVRLVEETGRPQGLGQERLLLVELFLRLRERLIPGLLRGGDTALALLEQGHHRLEEADPQDDVGHPEDRHDHQ